VAKKKPKPEMTPEATVSSFRWMTLLEAFVRKFGWPALVVVFGGWFIVQYASLEQKRELIDRYVLGKGIEAVYPIGLLAGLFVVVLYGQYRFYQAEVRALRDELARVGKEKSDLQEWLAGRSLNHRFEPKKIEKKDEKEER
jgi:hypothetical protein